MIGIRIHGRGGQGVKKSAQILGTAAYFEGYKTQDFAVYGAERRGAPVTSFVRIDREAIRTRGYIFEPDFIIILDDTLDMEILLRGRKKETMIIMNTHRRIRMPNLHKVDATHIVLKYFKRPITNVAMLGAFAKVSGLISVKNLSKAALLELKKYDEVILKNNIKAAKEAFEQVK
jgi:2-oxoacid:acceptor oxidoreductase gamma subunit (pyruvate/2-ketoisovalerate family)